MKEMKIEVPKGYEIDREHSTFECIRFKEVQEKPWRYKQEKISGYLICSTSAQICGIGDNYTFNPVTYDVFATEKQAKSALAMAQISQIMANDNRFGGVVTDEEWNNIDMDKYAIYRHKNQIETEVFYGEYHFLAFHTSEQRDLFLEENEDLVKQYLMID